MKYHWNHAEFLGTDMNVYEAENSPYKGLYMWNGCCYEIWIIRDNEDEFDPDDTDIIDEGIVADTDDEARRTIIQGLNYYITKYGETEYFPK